MKSCLLDTNVILRFILKDHPTLSPKARKIILGYICHIDNVVIAEVIWVLSSTYHQPAALIASLLKDFLTNETIKISNLPHSLQALNLFETQNLCYIDCYLTIQSKHQKIPLKTFDTKLQKLAKSQA